MVRLCHRRRPPGRVRPRPSGTHSPAARAHPRYGAHGPSRKEADQRAAELWAEYIVKPIEKKHLDRFLRLASSLQLQDSLPTRVARVIRARAVVAGLTETEADVLGRSALGESRQEIAHARGTSEQTIRTQIGRMLTKTGHGSLFSAVGAVLREVARSAD